MLVSTCSLLGDSVDKELLVQSFRKDKSFDSVESFVGITGLLQVVYWVNAAVAVWYHEGANLLLTMAKCHREWCVADEITASDV